MAPLLTVLKERRIDALQLFQVHSYNFKRPAARPIDQLDNLAIDFRLFGVFYEIFG